MRVVKDLTVFENIKEIVITELSKKSVFIYLLGSVGTERFNANSDIDIAAYWTSLLDSEEVSKMSFELEEKLQREVDLVSLNRIDPIFARQVLETGRLIYLNEGRKGLHLKWRAEKMSEYPDFKYSRKIIEDHILTRKKYV